MFVLTWSILSTACMYGNANWIHVLQWAANGLTSRSKLQLSFQSSHAHVPLSPTKNLHNAETSFTATSTSHYKDATILQTCAPASLSSKTTSIVCVSKKNTGSPKAQNESGITFLQSWTDPWSQCYWQKPRQTFCHSLSHIRFHILFLANLSFSQPCMTILRTATTSKTHSCSSWHH